jgi:hypothetical protein
MQGFATSSTPIAARLRCPPETWRDDDDPTTWGGVVVTKKGSHVKREARHVTTIRLLGLGL